MTSRPPTDVAAPPLQFVAEVVYNNTPVTIFANASADHKIAGDMTLIFFTGFDLAAYVLPRLV